MFLSKVYPQLRNSVTKLLSDNILLHRRFCSAAVEASVRPSQPEQGIPDKLYKRIEVEVRGNDPAVLKSYGYFSCMAARHLGLTVTKNAPSEKPVHERLTVLKSVHIYKKHRVQYETRTYFRYLHFLRLTGSTADTFLEYIERNLPEGVAMKVTKVEIQRTPDAISAPMNV